MDGELYLSEEVGVTIWQKLFRVPEKHSKETDTLTFTFVTDSIESAVRQAKEVAGNKDVQVIGSASTVQQFIEKGLYFCMKDRDRLKT